MSAIRQFFVFRLTTADGKLFKCRFQEVPTLEAVRQRLGCDAAAAYFTYVDPDGDRCVITSQAELVEAVNVAARDAAKMHRIVVNLQLKPKGAAVAAVTTEAPQAEQSDGDAPRQPMPLEKRASLVRARIAKVAAKRAALGEGHPRRQAQLAARLELLQRTLADIERKVAERKEEQDKKSAPPAAAAAAHDAPAAVAESVVANDVKPAEQDAVMQDNTDKNKDKDARVDQRVAQMSARVVAIRARVDHLTKAHSAMLVLNKTKKAEKTAGRIAWLTDKANAIEKRKNELVAAKANKDKQPFAKAVRRGMPPHVAEKLAKKQQSVWNDADKLRARQKVLQAKLTAIEKRLGELQIAAPTSTVTADGSVTLQ